MSANKERKMAESSDNQPGPSHQLSEVSAAGYQPSRNIEPIQGIKAEKYAEHIIDLPDDVKDCWITGVSITPDGRRLLADYANSKIKMFSRDMKIICSLSLPDGPGGIAVAGDREAVVSALWNKLFILDVSDKQMSISRTVELSFNLRGIATYKDKLVVTSYDPSFSFVPIRDPPSTVKLIDHSGKVYWSTSTDQQGQQLFSEPEYVACYDDGRSSTVIVSDGENNMLTVLDSSTGSVISRRQFERKKIGAVTTDTAGNVYVYYWRPYEVAVWTRDLSEEKILLSLPRHFWRPALAYDTVEDELLVIDYKYLRDQ